MILLPQACRLSTQFLALLTSRRRSAIRQSRLFPRIEVKIRAFKPKARIEAICFGFPRRFVNFSHGRRGIKRTESGSSLFFDFSGFMMRLRLCLMARFSFFFYTTAMYMLSCFTCVASVMFRNFPLFVSMMIATAAFFHSAAVYSGSELFIIT